MGEHISITMEGDYERLLRLQRAMTPQGRARIVPVATRRVFTFIQSHFRDYALTHHDTADRLGAPHTKHMERAARNMTSEANADAGRIILTMAGIGRARHDVTIRAKDKRLTIPIDKESYGKRVADIKKKYGEGSVFRFRSKQGNDILAMTKGKGKRRTLIPLYVLRDEVFQKQDPDMLPTEREIAETGRAALREAINLYLKKGA